jgi:hypothetical protein
VVHKDVLSQADILIAMKTDLEPGPRRDRRLDRGPGDRQEGKRILGDLARLQRGEGYLWAPGHSILERVSFPAIRTFDSSRAPRRGESVAAPRTLAEVDLTRSWPALAAAEAENHSVKPREDRRQAVLDRELAAAKARIEVLEQENRELNSRLSGIAALAAGAAPTAIYSIDSGSPAETGNQARSAGSSCAFG